MFYYLFKMRLRKTAFSPGMDEFVVILTENILDPARMLCDYGYQCGAKKIFLSANEMLLPFM